MKYYNDELEELEELEERFQEDLVWEESNGYYSGEDIFDDMFIF